MKVKCVPAGGFGANCYIVYDEQNLRGALIDVGDADPGILEFVRQNGLKIEYILLTHGHFDHIGGVAAMKAATGARVFMNQKDEYLIKDTPAEFRAYYENIPSFPIDVYLKDGDRFSLGSLSFTVLETPGHTPGGVCISMENYLFSGDTLFKDSIGRTDFKYGDHLQLMASIRSKLLVLADETIVCPGHGDCSDLKTIRRVNYFLSGDSNLFEY